MRPLDEQGSLEDQDERTGRVGYCRPPPEHRFKPGVSGNPRGRPRKQPAVADESPCKVYETFSGELGRQIRVTEAGKPRKMSMFQAMVRGACNQALQGDLKAIGLVMRHAALMEREERKAHRRRLEREVDYKRRSAEKAHQAEAMGYPPFEPLPHLGDIELCERREQGVKRGSINGGEKDLSEELEAERATEPPRGDKKQWEGAECEREIILSAIDEAKAAIAYSSADSDRSDAGRNVMMLEYWNEMLARLDAFYPPAKQRRQPGFNLKQWRQQKVREGWKCPIFD